MVGLVPSLLFLLSKPSSRSDLEHGDFDNSADEHDSSTPPDPFGVNGGEYADIDNEHNDNDIIRHLEEDEDHADGHSTPSTGPSTQTLNQPERTMTAEEKSRRDRPDRQERWYQRFWRFLCPETSEKDIENYIPNYRITPIVSGIVIPFSILLEIPGLTDRWYIKTEGKDTVDTKPNPVILDVGLGFSIVCAVFASAALITRFLGHRVKLSTIVCVVFLTIHGETRLHLWTHAAHLNVRQPSRYNQRYRYHYLWS
jgi:potassium channel subfamily K, other eukaryote